PPGQRGHLRDPGDLRLHDALLPRADQPRVVRSFGVRPARLQACDQHQGALPDPRYALGRDEGTPRMTGWDAVWAAREILWQGLLATLALSAAGIIASTVIGFLVGFARYVRVPVLDVVLRVYLEVFRGTPLLIQLLFVYF